jgi:membrane protein required for colicin V production
VSGLDLFLSAGLALGVWAGLRTGALTQIVGAAGTLLGFLAATALMHPVGEMATASLGISARTAPALGFVVTFGAVVLGLHAAAHLGRKTLRAVKLGALDTLAGAAVGALRAAFTLSLLLLATGATAVLGGPPLLISEDAREASALYPAIEGVAPVLWDAGRAATPGIQEALVERFNHWSLGDTAAADDCGADDCAP